MEKFHKLFLTAACLAGLSLSSCVKDAETVDVAAATTKTFRATTELATRTTLDGDHNVIWSKNDQIVVFGITDAQNNSGKAFQLVEGAGTTVGVFSGSIDNGYAGYYALYPYSCYKSVLVSGKYKILLNPNAVFTERNFVDGANPMIAYGTENDGFKFHNLCGIVEFRITGSGSINSIEVISGDNKPLSGMFFANPKTCELEATNSFGSSVENFQCIYAQLDTPVELSATPRSIYAVLPPATYENLQIRTIDTDGNITVRKATKPIEVTRSHIVPVSEFSHAPVTDMPYVTIYYDEESSNFYQSKINFETNAIATGFYYRRLSYADYENLAAQGQSDFQILAAAASNFSGNSASMKLTTLNDPGSKYVMLGLAYQTTESGNAMDTSNISKLVFSAKQIPFDNTLTPQVTAESIKEDNAMFFISGSPLDNYRTLASVFSDDEYNSYTDAERQIAATLGLYTNHHSDSANYTGYKGLVAFGNLLPNTKYHLVYTVTDGINSGMFSDVYTRYAPVREYEFTTPAHVPSAATVTLSEPVASDYSAEFTATAGEGVTKIKYLYTMYQTAYSADDIAAYGTEAALGSNESTVIKMSDLLAETTYYIYAVAYDENSSYGVLSTLTLTTLAPIPVDDPEYAKFVGTYTLTLGSGTNPTPRTVTISEDVKGKTFKVKGLINPSIVAQYSLDDTVEATFNNGEICISPQEIADSGTIPSRFDGDIVTMHLREATYSWYNPSLPLRSTYNDGVLTLKATDSDGMEWDGFQFMVGNRGYIEYYRGIVLTKQN